MVKPELLSPVGTQSHLNYALAYGADAVYAGMPRYGLRVRENDFNLQRLAESIDTVHSQNKKIYITANILPHNSKIKTFVKDIAPLAEMRPDAFIMADPGLIMLVREKWPDQPIHLSVQANTVNYAAVKFWQAVGVERIILSRELSLDEVAEIRQQCPQIELEVFVHGALCMAYSGRCLLSGYINHRDANQGTCTNACRWKYKPVASTEHHSGDLQAIPDEPASPSGTGDIKRMLVAEMGRPDKAIAMEEDEHGTYIMNSKDLRAVEHVQRLVDIGIDSLKIEGRTKSVNYVARVTQAYRQAIDDAVAGRAFDPSLLGRLENLASRGYTDGFFKRHHSHEYQNYLQGHSKEHQQQYVAQISGYDAGAGMLQLISKNHFAVGDMIELILPQGNRTLTLESIETQNGEALQRVPGGGFKVRIPFSAIGLDMSQLAFGLVARFI
jgi:putative protease